MKGNPYCTLCGDKDVFVALRFRPESDEVKLIVLCRVCAQACYTTLGGALKGEPAFTLRRTPNRKGFTRHNKEAAS